MRAYALTDENVTPALIDVPAPEPGPGEVRVRIHAASVNGFDLAVAGGYTKGIMEHRYPLVLGKDFAGQVDTVGEGVEDYAPGDRVFGVVTKDYLGDGSFAEFVTVSPAVGLAKLPDTVSFEDAGALGLAGAAAQQAVAGAALQPGQVVLVVGATGGVGTQVVQLAKAAGATVLATAATEPEVRLLTSLGADTVIDRTGDVLAQVRAVAPQGVDAVVHLAGDVDVLAAVKDGGRFVSTLVMDPSQLPSETATVVPVYAAATPELLRTIAELHANGTTRVEVQAVYPLAQVSDAFAAFAAGTIGKLVVTLA